MKTIKDFYDFSSKMSMATFLAFPFNIRDDEKNKLIYGEFEGIKFPVVFKQDSGKKLHDMLDTGYVSLYLISEKMKNIFEENNLMGWQTFPIIVLDKKGKEVKGYHGFSVTGRCGPVDYTKCEIIEKRLVPTGPICKFYRGLYIGLDKWDGNDFFIPEGTIGIRITTKAADVIKKNKLTNVTMDNLADIETPEFDLKIRYPEKFGPLSEE